MSSATVTVACGILWRCDRVNSAVAAFCIFILFFVLFLGFRFNWKAETLQFANILRSINWNVSRLPPLNGILQRFKRLWSTSEEVLHAVQSIHRRAWVQISDIVDWRQLSFGLMCWCATCVLLTFDNINHTQAEQRRYMIGSRRVNCDGAAHAVANHHDGRRGVSIERLHYFANIPFGRTTCKSWRVHPATFLQNHQCCFVQCAKCRQCKQQQLTWPLCLLRDRLGFSLWSRLPKRKEAHFTVLCRVWESCGLRS